MYKTKDGKGNITLSFGIQVASCFHFRVHFWVLFVLAWKRAESTPTKKRSQDTSIEDLPRWSNMFDSTQVCRVFCLIFVSPYSHCRSHKCKVIHNLSRMETLMHTCSCICGCIRLGRQCEPAASAVQGSGNR